MMGKKALICGISGQDGAYLANLLISKNYSVIGTSRDALTSEFKSLKKLGVYGRVELVSMSPSDFRSVLSTISTHRPDEIYNLSGQSSVGLSFAQPVETLESIATGTLNFLEVIRFLNYEVRFYNSGSGECFGDTGGSAATEKTAFRPRSPYAVAKSTAHWEVANYREAYDLFACTGILFNHDSPLRPERFVTRKVVEGARRIADNPDLRLKLGNLSISRDWGWAPDYVLAMWMMMQQDKPDDFVIATGVNHSLQDFVEYTFSSFDLEWKDHIDIDPMLFRPTDIEKGLGDYSKAARVLGWQPSCTMKGVIDKMIDTINPESKELITPRRGYNY